MTRQDPASTLQRLAGRMIGQLANLPVHHLLGRRPEHAPRAPGSAPGTVFEQPGAAPTRIRAFRYDDRTFEKVAEPTPETLAGMQSEEGRRLWVDVAGFADSATIANLGRLFGVHRLVMADVVNTPQRPKAQRIGPHRLILTQLPHLNPATGAAEFGQLALIVGPDYLITFREHPDEVFAPILARFRTEDSRLRSEGVEYLAYAVLDLAIDSYFPVVESLSDQIDGLEESVLEGNSADLLTRIHGHRHGLILLGRILWRNRDMVNGLARSEEFFPPSLHIYLQDVHDHAVQLLDMVETIRELANSLVEVHLALINNRMNQVMKTLTIMASIFIPLTFLAGIYGMNFAHMPELEWTWAYPAVLGLMLVVAVGLLAWFWKRGWIGGSG